MWRLSLWLVAFALDVRRSETILVKSSSRSDFEGVLRSRGQRVSRRAAESIMSFLRSKTSEPTSLSLSSASRLAWCNSNRLLRSVAKEVVNRG